MASFTETNLPQFKPYVSELPPEVFHEVGQQKQQQYNQGVQLVQNQINNVAGLDVLRQTDKDYLHSKLNELGNNITGFLASDFSDNQLVNSVAGMASSVAKDSRIQNAVYSTQKARTEMSNMQQAQKDGKSSPANDFWFQQQLNDYVNNQDPTATFNGRYIEKYDYEKPLLEKIKAAHLDKTAEDENITYTDPKTGQTKINQDVLNHVIHEGLSRSRVGSIIDEVFSSPEVQQQLQIEGHYNYQGYDANKLIENQATALDFRKQQILSNIPALSTQAKMGKGDVRQKAINDIQTSQATLKNLNDEFETFKQLALSNPDAAKTYLYTQNKKELLTNENAWMNNSSEMKINPAAEMSLKHSQFNLEAAKFKEQQKMDDERIKEIHSTIDKNAAEVLKLKADAELAVAKSEGRVGKDGSANYKTIPASINTTENDAIGSSSYYDELKNIGDKKMQALAEFGFLNSEKYQDFYIKDATGKIVINPQYIDKDPHSKYIFNDKGSAIYNKIKADIATNARTLSDMHRNGQVDPNYSDAVKNWYDMMTLENTMKQKANEVEDKYKPIISSLDKYTKNLPYSYNVDVTLPQKGLDSPISKNINLESKDLRALALYSVGYSIDGTETNLAKQQKEYLKQKYGLNEDEFEQLNFETTIQDRIRNNITSMMSELNNSSNKQKLEQREKEFKDLQQGSVGNTIYYSPNDKEDRLKLNNDISNELNQLMGDKSSGKYQQASELLNSEQKSDKIKNNYHFEYNNKTNSWTVKISQQDENGKWTNVAPIELSPNFVKEHGLDKEINPVEAKFNNSNFGKLLNLNGGNSTFKGDASDMYSPEAAATALERVANDKYSLGFHLRSASSDNTLFRPYLYTKDLTTGEESNVPLDWSKCKNIKSLPTEIKDMIANKKSIYDKGQVLETVELLQSYLSPRYEKEGNEIIKALIGDKNK